MWSVPLGANSQTPRPPTSATITVVAATRATPLSAIIPPSTRNGTVLPIRCPQPACRNGALAMPTIPSGASCGLIPYCSRSPPEIWSITSTTHMTAASPATTSSPVRRSSRRGVTSGVLMVAGASLSPVDEFRLRGANPPRAALNWASPMTTLAPDSTADELLRALAGPDARFREHQREAIEDLVVGRRRVLCVQRTGWGKSAVYFIATAMLRAQGEGPTLLISPLLALMRNQIEAAERLGLRAHTVNSTNRDDWDVVRDLIERDEVDLLLISPERLNNRRFRETMLPLFARRVGLLVIDEAHCVSDWGHDFRPDYRRIRDALEQLRPGAAVLCTTATANDRVVADVEEQLGAGARGEGSELRTYRGELARSSLRLEVVTLPSQAERLAWLARWLPELRGSGIVYCLTKCDTESVAAWLNGRGISALAYSGEVDDASRVEVERRLLANDVKAVVATSALGMGYDKPDLGFVVHYQAPGSAIAYYQQVGRAGRALTEAHAVLLRGVEDRDIQDYFIASAFPPREKAEAVVEMIASAEQPVRLGELASAVNLGQARLTAMLKVLDVEGAVTQDGSGWVRTAEQWSYDARRYEAVTALRRREQDAMERYGLGDGCLMRV